MLPIHELAVLPRQEAGDAGAVQVEEDGVAFLRAQVEVVEGLGGDLALLGEELALCIPEAAGGEAHGLAALAHAGAGDGGQARSDRVLVVVELGLGDQCWGAQGLEAVGDVELLEQMGRADLEARAAVGEGVGAVGPLQVDLEDEVVRVVEAGVDVRIVEHHPVAVEDLREAAAVVAVQDHVAQQVDLALEVPAKDPLGVVGVEDAGVVGLAEYRDDAVAAGDLPVRAALLLHAFDPGEAGLDARAVQSLVDLHQFSRVGEDEHVGLRVVVVLRQPAGGGAFEVRERVLPAQAIRAVRAVAVVDEPEGRGKGAARGQREGDRDAAAACLGIRGELLAELGQAQASLGHGRWGEGVWFLAALDVAHDAIAEVDVEVDLRGAAVRFEARMDVLERLRRVRALRGGHRRGKLAEDSGQVVRN